MSRRERYELGGGRSLCVASAEDVVVHKLRWFRLGGEVSDNQWRDVLAVLRVRKGDLDSGYLEAAGAAHDVKDLLERAIESAGI